MVKFTSKSEVTQACMNSIYYNLRNKISDRKYAKVVQTVNSGFKGGSMESIWKSFKKHKQHINRNEFLQLKNDVIHQKWKWIKLGEVENQDVGQIGPRFFYFLICIFIPPLIILNIKLQSFRIRTMDRSLNTRQFIQIFD